jgi:hypothetical protein
MRVIAVLFLATLATACTDPALTAGLRFDGNGVSLVPSVSGRVGGATVSVSP